MEQEIRGKTAKLKQASTGDLNLRSLQSKNRIRSGISKRKGSFPNSEREEKVKNCASRWTGRPVPNGRLMGKEERRSKRQSVALGDSPVEGRGGTTLRSRGTSPTSRRRGQRGGGKCKGKIHEVIAPKREKGSDAQDRGSAAA